MFSVRFAEMANRNRRNRQLSLFRSLSRKVAAAAFLAVAVMVFQPEPLSATLSLLDAVRTALDHAPGVQLEKQNLRISESDLLLARSAFDRKVSLSLGYQKDAGSLISDSGLQTVSTTLISSTLLPFGLSVSPEASVSGYTPAGSVSNSEASVGITFTLPLMEGLGNNESRMNLTASKKRYLAESLLLQHTASLTVYSAADAYWNYVYAYRTLRLDHQLSRMAEESYRATKSLAGAGEVAMIRADHAEAYLQLAEAAEVSDAHSLREAWNALLLSMGTSTPGREEPEEPLDSFPLPNAELSLLSQLKGVKAQALASRADLQALRLQGDAANDLVMGSRNRLKPRIDLDLWAGYNGYQSGTGIDDYLASLASHTRGVNVSATLRYAFDYGNHSDRSAFIRSSAFHETALINLQTLERTIESEVSLAVESVKSNAAKWHLCLKSADTYRRLNAAELKKYRMGMSDLFKVQNVSTDLSLAEKQLLAAEKDYASSLLKLRYEVASLIEMQDGCFRVERQNLLTVPALINPSANQ